MFQTLFDHVPIGVLVVEPSGLIQSGNPAVFEMFGYDPGELEGQPIELLLLPDARLHHVRLRERYFEERTPRSMGTDRELWGLRQDGSEFPVEIGLCPFPEDHRVFATVIDISVRQETQRALHEAQTISRTASWTLDLEKDLVSWSPELFRILQLPVAEKPPPFETHHTLFTPASWARLEPAIDRARTEGEPYELELELACTDQEGPRIAVARCQPERGRGGGVTRLVGTFSDVTETVRTRRQRDALLNRLSLAQSAAGIGVWEWDLESGDLVWDQRMHELYGIPQRPVTSTDWRNALHPSDRESVEERIQSVVPGNGHLQHQYRILCDDTERHLLAAASLVEDDGARRLVGVNLDVTESVLVQQKLEASEAHLRLVMQSLPDAVFTIRMPDRVIDYVNEEIEIILGYSPEEVLGQTTRLFYPEDEAFRDFGAKIARTLKRNERRLRSEEVLQHKDGRRIHCEVTVTFKHEDGELVGVISTVRSIEGRRSAQEALSQRQEQWDRFSAATSNMLWNWDFSDDSVERNLAFESLGYSRDEISAKIEWWVERLHDEDRVRVLGTFQDALENGRETTGYTYRFQRRDGTYATIRDRVFIMRDEDGRAYRALGAMTDISEQLLREEKDRRTNNLESLGLLAGGIAHDFNNLLTSILARVELLGLRAHDPQKVRETTAQIAKAVDDASGLTNQLLTFSRGGAPSRETVSIASLVRDQAMFSLRGSSSTVVFELADDLWFADVDPGQIGQVIQNLVLNADQAMAQGGELSIAAKNCEIGAGHPALVAGRYIEMAVADDGPGMSMDVLNRIFDPYFTTKTEGHGLGLSICHSIVERHGGSIRAESSLGRGTTFLVHLPAASESDLAARAEGVVPRGSGRVLVVDDLEEVRASITNVLEALGYRTSSASNPQEAVSLVRAAQSEGLPYDVVLTDLTIPGTGGGLEVLQQVKALDPELSVVVASGYANDPILAQYAAHGFDARLTKPIRMQSVARVLDQVLRRGFKSPGSAPDAEEHVEREDREDETRAPDCDRRREESILSQGREHRENDQERESQGQ